MLLRVNGQPVEMPNPCSVADLLRHFPVRGRHAVEVNGDIVPRSMHATRQLAGGDRVEIVQAIGGG